VNPEAWQAHLISVAVLAARLAPVAILCPMLGGPAAPGHVRLAVALALALFLHLEGGLVPGTMPPDGLRALGLALREAALGSAIGLMASLPFDTARMGGRLADLFRGSSAEAALPLSGTREAAAGDALHHLLLALAATGPLATLVVDAVVRSYRWAPPGTVDVTEGLALGAARLVGGACSTALALAAPVAAASLAVDTLVGLASRAAPGLNLQEASGPVKVVGGAAVLWLALGPLAGRLQDLLLEVPGALQALLAVGGASR
jgi:flagellar biosynthesis protein FliR